MAVGEYKSSTLTGNTWVRCYQIEIINPRGGQPTVAFQEEERMAIDGGKELNVGNSSINIAFNPSKSVPLLNPMTGEYLGANITYGDIYGILYSAYISAALERDAQAQAIIDARSAALAAAEAQAIAAAEAQAAADAAASQAQLDYVASTGPSAADLINLVPPP